MNNSISTWSKFTKNCPIFPSIMKKYWLDFQTIWTIICRVMVLNNLALCSEARWGYMNASSVANTERRVGRRCCCCCFEPRKAKFLLQSCWSSLSLSLSSLNSLSLVKPMVLRGLLFQKRCSFLYTLTLIFSATYPRFLSTF